MSKERFEWRYNEKVLKHYMVDNLNNQQLGYEDIVNLLNQQGRRIAELEEQLKNAIVPKFKYHQVVYAPFSSTDYYEGIIDVFDYYQKRYLVFFGDDVGNEWCYESEIFATKEEALAKLEELQGENK